MRVLLIATNQADRYMNRMAVRPVPVGLAYVAAHLDPARHHLQVLDLMFSTDAIQDATAAVQQFQPAVIGLSLRNLDNQSYLNPVWHLPAVRALLAHLRAVSSATLVCGGPAFSILPAACFEYLRPDLGLAGDATASFARLVDCLDSGASYTTLPGLVYSAHGHTVVQDAQFTEYFHTPPRLDLLDLQRYDKAGFGIGVVNKLAPYYYATGNAPEKPGGAGWRLRPAAEVVEEVRRLQRDYGIRKVFFIDSGFNMPLPQAKELCQALLQAGLKIRWNSYLRPGECDAELMALMQRSGCSLALLAGTAESATNGAELDEHLERVGSLTSLCRQEGVPFTLAMSFGNPGETRTAVERKLAFLRQTAPAFATLRVATRILPQTPLAQRALEEGLIGAEADLLRPTFYLDAAVRDWLVEHLRAVAAMQPRWHLM
jgi:B12 binding domain